MLVYFNGETMTFTWMLLIELILYQNIRIFPNLFLCFLNTVLWKI